MKASFRSTPAVSQDHIHAQRFESITTMPLDATDFVKIVASSAVIGAAVSSGISWLQTSVRENKNRQHERHHVLLEVAVLLERFVKACGDTISTERAAPPVAWDDQSWDAYYAVQFPEFVPPDSFNWRALTKQEAARLKDFVEAVRGVKSYISEHAEHADDPSDVASKQAVKSAEYGQKAWELALSLRASAGVNPASLESHHYGWVHDAFKERLERHANYLEQQRIAHQELFKDFVQPSPRAGSTSNGLLTL
ncbi:hypothetical protein [Cupriavidus pauculus]|uniref:Uncharacterized protein n=1 Tax=Cupriavidus pauculus TaxID=82633 RepID=A0A3G8GZV5_9BURK|nr:hypothetical protein [Cupriavidus pauculus]AZG13786.1 hypothetical protein EHF44_10175 [Cupriavidus pauculus]